MLQARGGGRPRLFLKDVQTWQRQGQLRADSVGKKVNRKEKKLGIAEKEVQWGKCKLTEPQPRQQK